MPKDKPHVLPHYQSRLRIHLPPDPGWRTQARSKDVPILAPSGDALFGESVRVLLGALVENLEEQDAEVMSFGLLLNLIQRFSPELRRTLVAAISDGLVLHTFLDASGGLVADLSPTVESLVKETGERRTRSGIIIPGTN